MEPAASPASLIKIYGPRPGLQTHDDRPTCENPSEPPSWPAHGISGQAAPQENEQAQVQEASEGQPPQAQVVGRTE